MPARLNGLVTGLYYFAVLFPNRRELARAVARLSVLKYRNYPTDHIMTKTTWLMYKLSAKQRERQ